MRRVSIPLVLAMLFLGAWNVQAQKVGRAEIRDAIHKLKSPNPEEVMTSIQILAASGSTTAVGPLSDLLRTGPRNDITNSIIQALGSIRSKSSTCSSTSNIVDRTQEQPPCSRSRAIMIPRSFRLSKTNFGIRTPRFEAQLLSLSEKRAARSPFPSSFRLLIGGCTTPSSQ